MTVILSLMIMTTISDCFQAQEFGGCFDVLAMKQSRF